MFLFLINPASFTTAPSVNCSDILTAGTAHTVENDITRFMLTPLYTCCVINYVKHIKVLRSNSVTFSLLIN